MKFFDLTCLELTREISSASPTPGGGSVAAFCGTLAMALCQMVANLTVRNKKYAETGPEMEAILSQVKRLENKLSPLMDEDAWAYSQVINAYRMPKDSDTDKAYRDKAIESALKGAAGIPLQTLTLAASAIDLIEKVIQLGNPNCITDTGVAAELILTAARGAAYNVAINLINIQDRSFITCTKEQVNLSMVHTRKKTAQIRKSIAQEIQMEAAFL